MKNSLVRICSRAAQNYHNEPPFFVRELTSKNLSARADGVCLGNGGERDTSFCVDVGGYAFEPIAQDRHDAGGVHHGCADGHAQVPHASGRVRVFQSNAAIYQ